MSAHRTLKDLFKAFTPTIGPGLLADPGSAGNIVFDKWGQICLVNTTGGGTRTLPVPDRAGVLAGIALDTDGGDLTLTVTDGYNRDADTSITFADAGELPTCGVSSRRKARPLRWKRGPSTTSRPRPRL